MVSSCSYNMILHLDILDYLWRISAISIVSRQFQYCPASFILSPDSFNTVWTFAILSGRSKCCQYGFNTIQTVSLLSRRFQFCLDGFNTVWAVLILSGQSKCCFSYVTTGDLRTFICREKYIYALRPESFCA